MGVDKSPTALRTIGEVAEHVGVATHVLRFWESKFSQIKPQKRRGRRYYRQEDINIIVQIRELLYNRGYTIRGVQKFLLTEFKDIKDPSGSSEDQSDSDVSELKDERDPYTGDLFASLAASDSIGRKAEIMPEIAVSNKGKRQLTREDVNRLEEIYFELLGFRDKLSEVA